MLSTPVVCQSFHGRREELNLLIQQFESAKAGRFVTVPVAGTAGIGKSRLIAEFARKLSATGAAIAVGQCLEHVQSPYLPFQSIFATILGMSPPAPDSSKHADTNGDDKLRYLMSIADQLTRATRTRAAVLVIEDVHWADTATLDLIEYLSAFATSARIMLVMTYRDNGLEATPRLSSLVAAIARRGSHSIGLAGLSGMEAKYLMRDALLGHATLSDDFLVEIAENCEGNPLFMEESLRSVIDHGARNIVTQRDMPLTMRAMLAERLIEFSKGEREILVRAAMIGRSFDVDTLSRISAKPTTLVLASLQKARELQLISKREGLPPIYEFRHALIRAALYDELIPELASALHASIASDMEARSSRREILAELAYHWSAAGDHVKAAAYYERAGDSACDIFAYRDAAGFYRKASRKGYEYDASRPHIYEKIGTALAIVGSDESPVPWLEEARDVYAKGHYSERLIACTLMLARQCSQEYRHEETTLAVDSIHAFLADDQSHVAHWHANIILARHFARLGDPAKALECLAAADKRRCPLDGVMSATLHEARALAFSEIGREAEFVSEGTAGNELANAANMRELEIQTSQLLGINLLFYGRTSDAIEWFERAMNVASTHGYLWRVELIRLTTARSYMLLGDLAKARVLVVQAMSSNVDFHKVRSYASGLGVQLGLMMNDRALVARALDEGVIDAAFATREPEAIGTVVTAYCDLYAARGEREKARLLIERAASVVKTAYTGGEMLLRFATYGDGESIAYGRELFRRFLGNNPDHALGAYYDLFEAICANARSAKPSSAAKSAAERFSRMSQPYYQAWALELAHRPQQALYVYKQIGATRESERLESLPNPSRAVLSLSSLTQRQQEVVKIICEGKSNREAGLLLNVTEKTIEHHLTEIYSRLDVGSRSQLVAHILGLNRAEAQIA